VFFDVFFRDGQVESQAQDWHHRREAALQWLSHLLLVLCVVMVFILCFERSLGDDVFTMEKTFCNYCLFLNLSVSVHR